MQTPPGEEPTTPGSEQPGANPPPPPGPSYPSQSVPPQAYPGMYGQPPYAPPYASYPGYGPYGQPYGPYGQPYGPPQPPPLPPRSSNKGLWIGLSILAAVILLSCVGCAVGAGLLFNSASRLYTSTLGPDLVANELCTDETTSDYTAVYDLFSSNLQSQMTQNQFVATSQAREQTNGVVRDCSAQAPSQAQNGQARVHITLTLNDGQHTGYITVVQSGGIWQIDSYDDSLGLT